MKKINFIFAFLIILFAFGQVKGQKKAYEDSKTKEWFFIDFGKKTGKLKVWYSPNYASNLQAVNIIQMPPQDSKPGTEDYKIEVNIPKKGICTISNFGYFEGTQIDRFQFLLTSNGTSQKFVQNYEVYVNPKNRQERIYIGKDEQGEDVYYHHIGQQTPKKLKQTEWGVFFKGEETSFNIEVVYNKEEKTYSFKLVFGLPGEEGVPFYEQLVL